MEFIKDGECKSRKVHRCYDCYQMIPARSQCYFSTTADMGRIATVYSHKACRNASNKYIADLPRSDFDDGVPPLADMIIEGGEIIADLKWLGDDFPEVVYRLWQHPEICREYFGDTKTVA